MWKMMLLSAFLTLSTAGCAPGSGFRTKDRDEPQDHCARDCMEISFDTSPNLSNERRFFSFPFPSDLRRDAEGHPELAGFPGQGHKNVRDLVALVSAQKGFSVVPAAFFMGTGEFRRGHAREVISASLESPVFLLDVDPASPEYGHLLPTVKAGFSGDGGLIRGNLLAVAPAPGIVLRPHTQYAIGVRRSLGDRFNRRLAVAPDFSALVSGRALPTRYGTPALKLYSGFFSLLKERGFDLGELASATVFTTGDMVGSTSKLTDVAVAKSEAKLDDVAFSSDGTEHERYCELTASVMMPQFQKGRPPFDTEGRFELGAGGIPRVQRTEKVPLTVALPRTPMPPSGWPVVLYLHGSGGSHSQVIDRGPAILASGGRMPDLGPAHVLARHGVASIGIALPLNPDRFPEGGMRGYLNFQNLAAYPDTFRQGVIEQRLLIKALEKAALPSAIVERCLGATRSWPAREGRFDTSRFGVLGQSHGSTYAFLLGALEPRISVVVPTGAGGMWSLLLDTKGLDFPLGALLLDSLSVRNHLHPGLRLLQWAWEGAEPVVFAPHVSKRPLPGHAPRDIYQPVGKGDDAFPEETFDALALSGGLQLAGETHWESMGRALSLLGTSEALPFPVKGNRISESGAPFTGVVVQFGRRPQVDMHSIFSEFDEVKLQYGCFFASKFTKGKAWVVAPGPENEPCGFQ